MAVPIKAWVRLDQSESLERLKNRSNKSFSVLIREAIDLLIEKEGLKRG